MALIFKLSYYYKKSKWNDLTISGKDSCNGDSGGPLMVHKYDEEAYQRTAYQIGLVILALIRVEWAYPEFTQKWQNSCHGLQRIWKLKWKEFDFWFSLTVLLIDQTLNKGCEFTGLRIPAIFAVFLYQTNAHIFVGLNK